MHSCELLGWSAASLMLLTFLCSDPRSLRLLAMSANVAFIAYGIACGLMPVLVLHSLLLPVNAWQYAAALRRYRLAAAPVAAVANRVPANSRVAR